MSLLTFNKLFRVLAGVVLGVIIGLVFSSLIFKNNVEDNNLPKGLIASSFHDAVEKASPSVVNIYSDVLVNNRRSQFPFSDRFNSILGFNKARIESSLGSGVIFYSNGYILTNQHVIGDRSIGITVELASGQKEEAKVIGIDKGTDLAVLKIDNIQELSSIEIANSDNLKIGDIVLAIGNPYGVGQSVSMGIVSATGREFNNPYSDYIQTDASINRGNSGGALIDTSGRLVGINTLIRSSSGGSEGVGLAIPSQTVVGIINDLIQYGEVRRGWLGFSIDGRILRAKSLLRVGYVYPNGPADKANLKSGDEIIEINGKASSYSLLFKEFARSKPGMLIKLKIIRGKQEVDIDLLTSSALEYK
tara:strand:- start:3037 stop:4119 length:1083 start_codon:yes stop_codon:yes gene_type:complete